MQAHSFGNWLKTRRKARDLTQAELADQVGCSAAAIRKLEAEERRPSAQIAQRLAQIFNIPKNEQTSFIQFARGDWNSAPVEAGEEPPWRPPSKSPRSNIPATTTSLIARGPEIAIIREYLSKVDIRLVTLIGPPGIGKTRLSIESARASLFDFIDGVFFVALEHLDDPSLIAAAIAQALGYVGATKMSTVEQLKEGIGDKQMLIVLDNCEHLIEDVSSLASGLLSACSRLKIISTSRESFRVAGEWLYPVPAFDFPAENLSIDMETASNFPALTLFAERARAVRPGFVLNAENIQTVSAICAQLDGLPLVIELIAARMRLMSPETLLARLNEQFILTADGMRAAAARQKTLNDAIGWSYELLSNEEQKIFAYLSVFSGGFTIDAAEAIFSRSFTGKAVSDLIASLLDKSLLQHVQYDPGESHYTMLVTIREFARERLRQMGEETEICNRHLAHFLNLAETADRELRGPNQLEWLHRLELLRYNLRAALEWAIRRGQTELALQMARRINWFWFMRSDHTEGRQWLQRVLEIPDTPAYPEAHAEVLVQLAFHTWMQISSMEARLFVEQGLSIARAHGDKKNIAQALSILCLIEYDLGNTKAAQHLGEESKRLFEELDEEWQYAHAVHVQANTRAQYEEAYTLFKNLGDGYLQGITLHNIGRLLIKEGHLTRAAQVLTEALFLARQLNNIIAVALVLNVFAHAAKAAGASTRAVCLYWASRSLRDSIGAWRPEDDPYFEESVAPRRAALGEAAYAEAMEQGRLMTMEQAIAYALETA